MNYKDFDIQDLYDIVPEDEDRSLDELRAENDILQAQVDELRKRSADFDMFNSTIQAGTSKHTFDKALTCYWANEYFFFMIGYTKEEFELELKSSIIPLLNPADYKKFMSEFQYCIERDIPNFQIQLRITHKEGHELFYKTAVSLFTSSNNQHYFYCIHTDITTATRSQLLANRQTRFLEALCNSMVMGICQLAITSPQSANLVYANATAFQLFGCEKTEFQKLYDGDIINIMHPEDRDFVAETIILLIKEGGSAAFECRIVDKSGKTKWLYTTFRKNVNQDGKPVILCEFKDISESKQLIADKKSLLDNVPGFVAKHVYDKKPYLLEANDKFYEFFGTSFEDYQSSDTICIKSFSEDINSQIAAHLDDIMNRRPVSFTYRARKPDGSIAWLQYQASCVGETNGCPVYLSVQVEITQVKELQLKLEAEKERYRIAYQTSTDTLFEYDIVNDSMEIWWKTSAGADAPPTVSGKYLFDIINDENVFHDDVETIRSFLRGNTKIEVRYFVNDLEKKRLVWTEVDGVTIYTDNLPIKVIGTYHSISDQDYSLYDKIEAYLRDENTVSHAIVRMDIDNFKMVNDLYGWSEGDKILSYIANQLKDIIPKDKCPFGRVTADIFCFCVPYKDRAELIRLIKEIRLKIQEYPVDFNIVPHFGIYIAEPGCKTSASVMFDWANLALKTVKEKVYTPFAFFDENLRDKLFFEKKIEHEMQSALDKGQFVTFMQPKYDISTGKVVGAEALVRWEHPENGLMSPNSFIPLFEKNGFILKVDEYTWENVCKTMRRWLDEGYELIPISVNISRTHIFDPNFCTKLKKIIKKYRIPPDMLILEFTESVFLDDVSELCRIMSELRDEGFLLSMDDFGSGFSSLNMLKTIPLNEVKIDKEFLNETVSSHKGKTVVASTIFMVNQLEMKIIAEGVETAEQAEFLLAAGCDTAQGFYYSKPVPISEFEKLAFGKTE